MKKNYLDRVAEGHVVKDFYVGHTHIKICDDCCRDKTPEQVKEILNRIARIAIGSMRRAAAEKDNANKECVEKPQKPE